MLVLLLALSIAAETSSTSPLRIGLMIGEPISVTVGWSLTERFVLQADIGPSTSRHHTMIGAADLVYVMPEVLAADRVGDHFVPWFGLGMRYAAGRDAEPNRFGPRVPFGISFFVLEQAIELFMSVAPGVGLAPDLRASIDGGIGVRLAL